MNKEMKAACADLPKCNWNLKEFKKKRKVGLVWRGRLEETLSTHTTVQDKTGYL